MWSRRLTQTSGFLARIQPAVTTARTAPARKRFYSALLTSARIYAPAREWSIFSADSFQENPYQPRVAQKIVGLAFLGAVAAWEEFLEDAFLGYMAGATSDSGFSPSLRLGPCRSRTHAVTALSGAAQTADAYRTLRWSDFSWVAGVAEIYFVRGRPFSAVSPAFRERLRDAQVIRNRVAHNSRRARTQFKKVANHLRNLSADKPLPHGFSPGRLLVEPASAASFGQVWLRQQSHHHWGDLFEAYVSMFEELAFLLVPGREVGVV